MPGLIRPEDLLEISSDAEMAKMAKIARGAGTGSRRAFCAANASGQGSGWTGWLVILPRLAG